VVPIYNILYVDDEQSLLEIGKLFLEEGGLFTVDIITSARAALALMETKTYDAIVSDYQMPFMDGIGLLKTVRSLGNTIPFILFTGRGREEIVIQALNEGANFYLQKGGDPDAQFAELSHKIQTAIEHHRAAEKIQSLNRLYSVLSATSKAIFHIRTASDFFPEICRILVETGGFRMAWIGLADPYHCSIPPVAHAGHVDGYLDDINISTEDVPRGRGPTGTAYREGKYYFSNDIERDPRMEPWRENALKRGYRSNAAFPFALGTKNAGVLSLYAPVPGFFDPQVIELLQELAVDIAFALRTIDDRSARIEADTALRKTEEKIRESEEFLRTVITEAREGIVVYDRDLRILLWNRSMEELTGMPAEAVLGRPTIELFPFLKEQGIDVLMKKALAGTAAESDDIRFHISSTGKKGWSKGIYSPNRDAYGSIIGVIGIVRDITARKTAEYALQKSEQRYRNIVEDQTEFISRFLPDGTHVFVNEAYCRYFGVNRDGILGHRFLPEIPAGDQTRVNQFFRSLTPDHPVDSIEHRILMPDGSVRWQRWSDRAIFDASGKLIEYQSVGRDITERKRAEEALQKSEGNYRGVIENLQDVFYRADTAGNITMVSPSVTDVFGYGSAEEVIGLNLARDFYKDPANRRNFLDAINKTGSVKNFEAALKKKDGSTVIVSTSAHYYRDPDGSILGIEGIAKDITEQKQAEEALWQEQLFSSSVLDSLPGIFYLYSYPECRLLLWNRQHETIFGFTPEEMKGRHITDWHVPEGREAVMNAIEMVMQKGQASMDAFLVAKDGRHIPFFLTGVRFESRGQSYLMGVGTDITGRRQAEDALRSAYEQIAASEEELRAQFEELKKAEDALRESERKFQGIVKGSPIPQFVIDNNHRVVSWNRALEEYSGVKAKDVLGTTRAWKAFYDHERPVLSNLLVDDNKKKIAELYAGKFRESRYVEDAYEVADFFPRMGEQGTWLYFTASALKDSAGNIVGAVETLEDITDRRRAEDALRASFEQITASEEELRAQFEELKKSEDKLRKSEEKYRNILENIQDVYYRSDTAGNLIDASPSALALFGYESFDEIIGKPIADTFYLNKDERNKFLTLLKKTGSVQDYEIQLRKKDGTPVVVSTASHFYLGARGEVAGIEGIFRDITEKKRMERDLLDSARRLSEIISFLPDATFAIDRDGTVIAWNRAMEEMTGIPAGQILGQGNYVYAVPFYGTRRPLLIDLVFSPTEEVVKNYTFVEVNGKVLTAETTNATPRGKEAILWGKAAPLYDRQGNVTGALESIRDITDRRRGEEALAAANRKLKLLSGITRHDISNQLTTLRGHISYVKKTNPDNVTGDHLRKIAAAAQHIASMIRFTREYEEIGASAPVWQNCHTLVDTAVSQVQVGKIAIINEIPAGDELFADPMIVRVFANLTDNAVRHGGKITAIRFFSQTCADGQLIVCEDNGDGIPSDEKEQIFVQGFGKNTGMGLFLAREILAITDSTIRESGEPGKGTRFEILVPRGSYRVQG
jgi:PAS domain S-box-containing protein